MRNYAQYIANAAVPNINASHQDVLNLILDTEIPKFVSFLQLMIRFYNV